MGLRRYVHDHHPNPLRSELAELRRKSYKLVGEVAKTLGVSQTTPRRMEAEGVIPKARRVEFARGKSVRAFTAKEVECIERSRARSGGERSIRDGGRRTQAQDWTVDQWLPVREIEVWLANPGRECVMSHSRARGAPRARKKFAPHRGSFRRLARSPGYVPAGCP